MKCSGNMASNAALLINDTRVCCNLTDLFIGGTYLEGELPETIGNLINLTGLTLSYNNFDIQKYKYQIKRYY